MSTCSSTPLTPAGNAGLPTFAQAKASNELITACGNCNTSAEFAEYINNGTERLMYRGDWPGTELPIHLSVKRGIVTMPRQVGAVRKMNVTRRYVPVFNDMYAFMPWNWSSCGFTSWLGWIDPLAPSFTQYGTSCTFDQPSTDTCVLQVSGISDDFGAILQFFGTDPQGNALRTDNGDGTFSNGISLSVSALTTGTVLVKYVGQVVKPKTQGPISLYAFDTSTGIQTPLAVYDPSDTNPSFAQYNLHAACCNTSVTWSAVAQVKLKFIPVEADTDLILIPNLHALALFIKGMRFADSGDRANALAYQADAVKELNLQLADVSPDEQTPIQINPFGSAPPWKSGIGRII
jgi:hypothetical protein